MNVNELEDITGMDFFAIFPDKGKDIIEGTKDYKKWNF